jgi:hypothetical protein
LQRADPRGIGSLHIGQGMVGGAEGLAAGAPESKATRVSGAPAPQEAQVAAPATHGAPQLAH